MIKQRIHRCPVCGKPLQNVMERPAKEGDLPEPYRAHAHKGEYAVRDPIGIEVLGECMRDGMQRFFPMGTPYFDKAV